MMPQKLGRPEIIVLSVLIGAASGSAGCKKEPSGPSGPTLLAPRDQPYVADVPVPDGFTLDAEKSDHKFIAGRRQVKHYYLGREEPLLVRGFYIHSMPISGWTLVDEKLHNNVYTITFRKAEERCEIRIEEIPAGLFKPSTRIRATVRSPGLEPLN